MIEAAVATRQHARGDFSALGRPSGFLVALAAVAVVGAIAFGAGALGLAPDRAWQAYLVNLLLFTGIAQAGAVFLAILSLTRSRWGAPLEGIAAAMTAFLPLAFGLFLLLPFGRVAIFPWVSTPIPEKALWLNFTFLMARDGVGLAILFALTAALVYQHLRPVAWRLRHTAGDWRERVYALLTHHFGAPEQELRRSNDRIPPLSIGLVTVYCFVFSLLAGDLIMSLDPHWYSTLFGAYNFMVALYVGLAAMVVLAIWERARHAMQRTLSIDLLHDAAKLIFAFALIAGDFFWSQYVVIWYGNLPEETSFIAHRIHQEPWRTLTWIVLLGLFVLPFVLLLARAPKRNPQALAAIAGLIVISGWIERYTLIVPSLTAAEDVVFGALEVLVALGFLAAFLLCYRLFLAVFPCQVSGGFGDDESA